MTENAPRIPGPSDVRRAATNATNATGRSRIRGSRSRLALRRELVRSRREIDRLLAAQREMALSAQDLSRRIRSLVDGLEAVVWEADGVTYTMTFVSERSMALFGYRPKEWIDETGFWESHVHPEDREAAIRACDEAIGAQTGVNLEYRFRRRDGTWVWVRDVIRVAEVGGSLRLTGVMIDISDRKELEAELERRASRDALTGLPNRRCILDRLSAALVRAHADGSRVGLLFLDLDGFKRVNDSLGHAWGDRLLKVVARRLAGGLRASDTIGRLGGDEFVVIIEDTTEEQALLVAERLLARLAAPMRLARREIVLGASVGVALSNPKSRADDLIRDADLAMSDAKTQGKRQIRLFEPTMHRELLDRLTLEGDLRRAVRAGELRLAYQPIVDLASGRIVSVESLARWDHPTLGAVAPSRFIPLAEQTGLIVQLGRWALEESCRQVAEWDARAPGLAGIGISVNVSAHQLADPRFIEDVEAALERSGIERGRLSIELTESSLIGDGRHTDIALERLRALGVGLQVDDLGTGYSTLSNLTRIPISGLKIDRMFIAPVAHSNKDAAVVSALIAFGRSLDLAVVAEGIETPEQLGRLRELGCEFGQGYLLARPESPAVLEARNGAVAA